MCSLAGVSVVLSLRNTLGFGENQQIPGALCLTPGSGKAEIVASLKECVALASPRDPTACL